MVRQFLLQFDLDAGGFPQSLCHANYRSVEVLEYQDVSLVLFFAVSVGCYPDLKGPCSTILSRKAVSYEAEKKEKMTRQMVMVKNSQPNLRNSGKGPQTRTKMEPSALYQNPGNSKFHMARTRQ